MEGIGRSKERIIDMEAIIIMVPRNGTVVVITMEDTEQSKVVPSGSLLAIIITHGQEEIAGHHLTVGLHLVGHHMIAGPQEVARLVNRLHCQDMAPNLASHTRLEEKMVGRVALVMIGKVGMDGWNEIVGMVILGDQVHVIIGMVEDGLKRSKRIILP